MVGTSRNIFKKHWREYLKCNLVKYLTGTKCLVEQVKQSPSVSMAIERFLSGCTVLIPFPFVHLGLVVVRSA